MTFIAQDAYSHVGHDLYDTEHHKIGKINQAFRGPRGTLEWVRVSTGLLGSKDRFVPIAQAQRTDDGLVVPISKETVQDSPTIHPQLAELTADEEAVLRDYYTGGRPSVPDSVRAEVDTEDSDPDALLPGSNETSFGTGEPRAGEPDDVTLQGTGTSAPRKIV